MTNLTRKRNTAGKKDLAPGEAFVNLGFVAHTKFSTEIPTRTPSPETLVASLKQLHKSDK